MNNKKIQLLLILIATFILNGCMDADITLDVEKNGEMIVYSDVLVKDSQFKTLSDEELKKLKETYDDVEKITDLGKSGYRITDKIGNIKSIDLKNINQLDGGENFKDLITVNNEKHFLYNIYKADLKIKDYILKNKDNKKDSKDEFIDDKVLLTALGNSININFHLKSPLKLISSNATSISEEGKKYIYNWEYTVNNMDNLRVEAKIYNIQNIVILGASLLAILVIIVLIIIRYRKNPS